MLPCFGLSFVAWDFAGAEVVFLPVGARRYVGCGSLTHRSSLRFLVPRCRPIILRSSAFQDGPCQLAFLDRGAAGRYKRIQVYTI